ncbi:DUF5086 family protein [Rhizobium sp. R634]|uniref:DUF5086 family protein n=1 Tax=Rhizobium sp. R634 TaxID=1764274 RepID=UPI001FD8AAA0|nr:DUF5086 family protein [Rhizobium sp. R634]
MIGSMTTKPPQALAIFSITGCAIGGAGGFMRLFGCFIFGFALTGASAHAQQLTETVVLSVSSSTVRWADVYKITGRADDPYLHLRVLEKKKGTDPWVFKELAHHLVVTPQALEASRIKRKAKTYAYKDVEFLGTYRRWLNDPAIRAETPVCDKTILSCLKNAGSD